jgi:spoIIIJ-associated protein
VEWVVTTAATVDAARELALDELGVDAKEAEFDTVQEPSKGFIGIGAKPARVRARVTPQAQTSKQNARPRRRRSSAPRGSSGQGGQGGDGRNSKQQSKSSGKSRSQTQGAKKTDSRNSGTPKSASSQKATGSRNKKSTSASGKSGRSSQARSVDSGAPQDSPSTEEARVEDPMSLEEQGTRAQDFLAGFLDEMGATATLGIREIDEDNLEVTVDGDDLGLLIGQRGQTLQALQEVTKTVLQRQAINGANGRVRLDVAGYKARRREALIEFTGRMADQVLDSGEDCALEPMVSADRKVVHDAVNDIDGVETISEGTDPRRRVVIVPA